MLEWICTYFLLDFCLLSSPLSNISVSEDQDSNLVFAHGLISSAVLEWVWGLACWRCDLVSCPHLPEHQAVPICLSTSMPPGSVSIIISVTCLVGRYGNSVGEGLCQSLCLLPRMAGAGWVYFRSRDRRPLGLEQGEQVREGKR